MVGYKQEIVIPPPCAKWDEVGTLVRPKRYEVHRTLARRGDRRRPLTDGREPALDGGMSNSPDLRG